MRELEQVLVRIQMEYEEMPDLKLTARQVRRLWSLDQDICDAALAALVNAKFLWQTRDGAYLRRGIWPSVQHVA